MMPRRIPLELGLGLNINRLIAEGLIVPGHTTEFRDFDWLMNDGQVHVSAKISSDTSQRSTPTRWDGAIRILADWIDQTIRLEAQPRHFGGYQWYFMCPRLGRRAAVVWSPPSQRFFASRQSWGSQVAYLSQYHAPGPRAHYMAWKVCDRIGGPGAAKQWRLPPKPKGMRMRTYERLFDRCKKYHDKASGSVLPRKYLLDGKVV